MCYSSAILIIFDFESILLSKMQLKYPSTSDEKKRTDF